MRADPPRSASHPAEAASAPSSPLRVRPDIGHLISLSFLSAKRSHQGFFNGLLGRGIAGSARADDTPNRWGVVERDGVSQRDSDHIRKPVAGPAEVQ